jgi:hypothetical protein
VPFLPLLHQFVAVQGHPIKDFMLDSRWPLTFGLQAIKYDEYIETAACQVDMGWSVIPLPNLQSVPVPEAVFVVIARWYGKRFQGSIREFRCLEGGVCPA